MLENAVKRTFVDRPVTRFGGLSRTTIAVSLLLTIVLSLLAMPRRTGDAHQYIAMARQLALAQPPAITDQELMDYQAWLEGHAEDSGFPEGAAAMRQPPLVRDGKQLFSHFWFYSLLVTPILVASTVLDAHPLTAFVIANGAMLAAAILIIARTFGDLSALMMLSTPIVWFVGRAQVEVFTFSFLAFAVAAAATGRWGIASISAALASTQNAPIAVVIPLIWLGGLADWATRRRARQQPLRPSRRDVCRAAAFAIASIVIALLHPAYYLWNLGVVTPQQLNGGIATTMPSAPRALAPLLDPDIGFVAWLPVLTAVWLAGLCLTIAGLRWSWTNVTRTHVLVAGTIAVGLWFLFVFAQTTNVNSGGTVHVSRYVMWLLPLTLPAIGVAVHAVGRWAPIATALAVGLFLLYLGYFRPDQPERYVEQSPQSGWLLAHATGLYRPIPEIFVERTLHIDGGPRASAADARCRVLFIVPDQAVPSCVLTAAERAEINRALALGAHAVWIRRGTDGHSHVSAAL